MGNIKILYNEIYNYLYIKKNNFKLSSLIFESYKKNISSKFNKILNYIYLKNKKSDYAFIGLKFKDLIHIAHKDGGVLLVGGRDCFVFALTHKMSYLSFVDSVRCLVECWKRKNDDSIHYCIEKIRIKIKKYNLKMIIVSNDSLPLERAWIAAAREESITAVCFQHGLFSIYGKELNDGKYADIICVYDDYQSKIVMETGARKSYNFGFYRNYIEKKLNDTNRKVCILGQPWVEYYGCYENEYYSYLKIISDFLTSNQIDWYYKPHPGETQYENYINLFHNDIVLLDIESSLSEYDVFISLSSTGLLEATLCKKISIQIRYDLIFNENYEDIGYCFSIDIVEIESKFFKLYNGYSYCSTFQNNSDLDLRWNSFIKSIYE